MALDAPGPSEAATGGLLRAAEAEHKLVTALFCDIAGSTALAERIGAEAMHVRLQSFFDLVVEEVRRFGGTMDKFLGDGFLALFGAPRALEHHARRAVLAAVAIRDRLEAAQRSDGGVQVRIGVNSGPVVVGPLGEGHETDYTAIGDTTNVAARLQGIAAPGEILLGPVTAGLVRQYARLEGLGPVAVRGRDATVEGHRLLALGSRAPLDGIRAEPLVPFVGRDLPLAELRRLAALAMGGRGQVVGVVGEAGMGKSRMVVEFRRALATDRVTFLEGRCVPYGTAAPYLPLLDIVRQNCGLGPDDAGDIVAAGVRRALAEVGLDEERFSPPLLDLLGAPLATGGLADLSAEAARARTFEVLRAMALRGSHRRPLILVVEDLHWIDATSEAFLASLAESAADAPLLLLFTWRSGYRASWTGVSYATEIRLTPLAAEDGGRIVRAAWDGEPDDREAAMILERAEGNPLFLAELARALAADPRADAEIPVSIQDVIAARIDRLPEAPRRSLQAAAVLGRTFDARLLEEVWDGPHGLDAHIEVLRREGFLAERLGSEPGFTFQHGLMQSVAYQSLLSTRRRELHARAALALERILPRDAERLLAHHWPRAGRDDRAVEWLSVFAESNARRYAHEEAAEALVEAIGLCPHLPAPERDRTELDLTLRLVRSLYFLGRLEESRDRLERVRAPAPGPDSAEARSRFWRAHTASHLGDPATAEAEGRAALTAAEEAGDPAAAGCALYVLSREAWWTGRFAEGVGFGERAGGLLAEAGESWWLGHATCYLGHGHMGRGLFGPAIEAAEQALALGERLGDPRIMSFATWSRGLYEATRGEAEIAVELCQRAVELSPDPVNSAWSRGFLGFARLQAGEPLVALELLSEAARGARSAAHRRVECWFGGWIAEAALASGDTAVARERAEDALRTAQAVRCTWAAAAARRTLGEVAWQDGDVRTARTLIRQALDAYSAAGAAFEEATTRLVLARCGSATGKADAAPPALDDALQVLEELGAPRIAAALAADAGGRV